jgi:3-hydroxyisobutyrate dehydrogenase
MSKQYEPSTPRKTAFIGLGVMGYPMAGHLKGAGHTVTVYNRTAAKAADWAAKFGGSHAATPREAAAGCDVVACCVGNDDDLRSVILGPDGAFAGMKKGAVLVDHTTASANVARELAAEAARLGLRFIDAPVSGGQAGAENGVLTIMCGGEQATFDEIISKFVGAAVRSEAKGQGKISGSSPDPKDTKETKKETAIIRKFTKDGVEYAINEKTKKLFLDFNF